MSIKSKLMEWLGIQTLLEVSISMELRITRLELMLRELERENLTLRLENELIRNNEELFMKCNLNNDEDLDVKLDD